MPDTRTLLDIDELADRLGVTERFVRRLVEERRIPFLKIGKFVRFDPDDVERWINNQRVRQASDSRVLASSPQRPSHHRNKSR